jgi:hypothetical protein
MQPMKSELKLQLESLTWPIYLRLPEREGIALWGSVEGGAEHLSNDGRHILLVKTPAALGALRGRVMWPDPQRLAATLAELERDGIEQFERQIVGVDLCRGLLWSLREVARWPRAVRDEMLNGLNMAWDMATTLDHAETLDELRPYAPLGILADALTGRVRAFEGLEGPHSLPPPHVIGEGYARLVGRIQQWVRVIE